jgi:ubiquinone/menaquinone biosynthesis C-methylase UbiE
MDDWIDYYDSAHTIYVNARHRDVHFRVIADDIAAHVVSPDMRVLDYGCGEALHADRVAARTSRLFLCEAAPGVRERLRRRFGGEPRIAVIGPDELAALPDGSADLIIMHSVAQYLSPQEFDSILGLFRRLLVCDGTLVVGDILQPHKSALTDAVALLRFGAREGFFLAAFAGLLRTLFSSYWQLRSALGLTRYSQSAMLARLAAAGFTGRRAATNIGHNQARMTFLAQPAPAPPRVLR